MLKRIFLEKDMIFQIGGARHLVLEARQHVSAARDALSQTFQSKDLFRRLKETEVSVIAMEKWAGACDQGETVIQEAKTAVAAGDFEGAAVLCKKVQRMLGRGLKCESLREEVEDLQFTLNEGVYIDKVCCKLQRAGPDF